MAGFGATRRERFAEGAAKLGLALAPSELFALAWLALGPRATAVIDGMIGICVATTVPNSSRALAGGLTPTWLQLPCPVPGTHTELSRLRAGAQTTCAKRLEA